MAKTAAQWQILLDLVDAEIEAILTNGQSIGDDGSVHTRADLATLERMQARYVREIDKLARGNRRVAEFIWD